VPCYSSYCCLLLVCYRLQKFESESSDKVFFDGSTLIKPSSLAEDQCQQIPILPVSRLVLFPGQVLPLNLLDAREMSIIRHASSGNKVVGILTTK